MKKMAVLTIVVAMMAVMLAGCGESAGVKVVSIPLTQEEYAFGVSKDQPELLEKVNEFIAKIKSDGTFDRILDNHFGDGEPVPVTSAQLDQSKDQLVVATNAAFEPFEYMKGDKYYGVDMEIAQLLAEYLGKELVISNMDFEAVCLSVGQGKADIAMAGLTIKEDRKQYVNFSDKYYDAAQMIIVKASDKRFDNCKTAEDVENVIKGLKPTTKVGVQNGTTGQFYVEGDEEWGFEGFDVQVVGYKAGSLAVQDMLNGNIDFVVIDEAPAHKIVEAFNAMK
jgi:ABC-type amino acid transport substrate-binding protein